MLPVGWLVFAVVVAVLVSMWVTFTLTRLDRLHARCDAAQAALDAQLVRRAAVLQRWAETAQVGEHEAREHYERLARQALRTDAAHGAHAPLADRRAAENAVGRGIRELLTAVPVAGEAADDLYEVSARVQIARRFYNDAVRDTRTLRMRRMPRVLRLAGRRDMPQFFDIDDSVPERDEVEVVKRTSPARAERAETEKDPL